VTTPFTAGSRISVRPVIREIWSATSAISTPRMLMTTSPASCAVRRRLRERDQRVERGRGEREAGEGGANLHWGLFYRSGTVSVSRFPSRRIWICAVPLPCAAAKAALAACGSAERGAVDRLDHVARDHARRAIVADAIAAAGRRGVEPLEHPAVPGGGPRSRGSGAVPEPAAGLRGGCGGRPRHAAA
jgi:hypothetical protein